MNTKTYEKQWRWRDSNPRSCECYLPVAPARSGGLHRLAPAYWSFIARCPASYGALWRSVSARHWFISLLPRLPGAVGLLYSGIIVATCKAYTPKPSELFCRRPSLQHPFLSERALKGCYFAGHRPRVDYLFFMQNEKRLLCQYVKDLLPSGAERCAQIRHVLPCFSRGTPGNAKASIPSCPWS